MYFSLTRLQYLLNGILHHSKIDNLYHDDMSPFLTGGETTHNYQELPTYMYMSVSIVTHTVMEFPPAEL